jgi:hypothetical protein
MKIPKSEIRSPKEIQNSHLRWARSVMEWGGPSLLSAPWARSCAQSTRGLAQSRSWRLRLAWAGLLAVAFSVCAQAQYTIDWFTLDGGGGTSTGGGFEVSGTVGQPDAGKMSGGGFTLEGGFWSVVTALEAEGRPRLGVSLANHVATVWWRLPATGYVLDQTTTLSGKPIPWAQVPFPYQTNSTWGIAYVTVPTPAGTRFYQLRKPGQP